MKNPSWFKPKTAHKALRFGPDQMYLPLCKLAFRDNWPNSGCWELEDVTKWKWKDVECPVCNAVKSPTANLEEVAKRFGIKIRKSK